MVQRGELGKIFHFRAAYQQDWIVDPNFPLTWQLTKGRQAKHDGYWQVHDDGRVVFENEIQAKSILHRALLRSIQQGLLTEESLQLAFVVVRLGQIDRSSSARDFQFKLSVIPSWLDPQAADREELMRPDRQRLYSQLLKRLLSVSQLLRATSK